QPVTEERARAGPDARTSRGSRQADAQPRRTLPRPSRARCRCSPPWRSLVPVLPRLQIDHKVAVECVRDPEESVDPGRAASALETRDRRLRCADEFRQLALRKPAGLTPFGDLARDGGEEPPSIGGPDPLLQAFQRSLT